MERKGAELAGSWYRNDAKGLAAELDAAIERAEREYGGALAAAKGIPEAVVVPHAGIAFSGAVAAAAYLLVRRAFEQVDAFVVFGACHRHRLTKPAIWNAGAWETPLGDIPVDEALASALIAAGAGEANWRAHLGDNAIELQAPFIRHLFPEAAIVPVAMGFFADSWKLGEIAADTAGATGKRVVAVASTDLTHYGAPFGVMPAGAGQPALDWTRANDERFLATLLDMDLKNIVPTAERDGSACGAGAAAAAAGWAKARGCVNGRLLAHTNSHEIMPRGIADHLVGYASLVYESGV